MKRGEEAQSLPLHSASEGAVASADDIVSPEEESGADGIGAARNERCSRLEACQRVLLNGEV